MTIAPPYEFCTTHSFEVFEAAHFRVTDGVNQGDAIGPATTLCPGDVYSLHRMAELVTLDLRDAGPGRDALPRFTVTGPSGIEIKGTPATVMARLTFMTQRGASVQGLVFGCAAGPEARLYFHPLGPVAPKTSYILIDIDAHPRDIALTGLTAMGFGRGTRVTRADGSQGPVEQLQVGERLLTRDHGMQPIRWIGTRTVQGVGAFAPVVISKGALGNAQTMTISQHHRMMISDWRAEVMVGARDVLVRAGDLVNGDTIYLRPGGFVEYTQLVFDQHQIVYSEGVPTESLPPSQLRPGEPIAEHCAAIPPRLPAPVSRTALSRSEAAALLRQTGRA